MWGSQGCNAADDVREAAALTCNLHFNQESRIFPSFAFKSSVFHNRASLLKARSALRLSRGRSGEALLCSGGCSQQPGERNGSTQGQGWARPKALGWGGVTTRGAISGTRRSSEPRRWVGGPDRPSGALPGGESHQQEGHSAAGWPWMAQSITASRPPSTHLLQHAVCC